MGEPNLQPQLLAGRYLLYDVIAGGGMATVHLARLTGSVGFARTVAIKRLHAQYANLSEFRVMFVDEARLAARITHPNVVQTLDVVENGDELFIVMEYIHGLPLSRLMSAATASGGVPINVAASVMCGVLQGLHAAHEATDEAGNPLHIVHRDVSPQNVLVGMDGVARLIDFGVAKAVSQIHTTREGQLKGKLAYMAPEQIRHGIADRQTDVFSAAVVLWQLLTGRKLFRSSNEGQLIYQLLESKIDPPSHFRPDVSAALDDVVLRGLSRSRDERFKTAREMLLALEQRAPLVTQRAVAEWATTVSEDELSERSNLVSRISRTSIPDLPVELSDAAVTLPRPSGFPSEPESSAIVAKSELHPVGRPWWRRPAAWVAAPALVLVVWGVSAAATPASRVPRLESARVGLSRAVNDARGRTDVVPPVIVAPSPSSATSAPLDSTAQKKTPPKWWPPVAPRPAPAPVSQPGNTHLYKRE